MNSGKNPKKYVDMFQMSSENMYLNERDRSRHIVPVPTVRKN